MSSLHAQNSADERDIILYSYRLRFTHCGFILLLFVHAKTNELHFGFSHYTKGAFGRSLIIFSRRLINQVVSYGNFSPAAAKTLC